MVNENDYKEPYRPRFGFEITEEQKARADRLISTYGLRKAVGQVLLEDLLDLIEEYGQVVIGVLLSGRAKPHEILPTLTEAKRKGEA